MEVGTPWRSDEFKYRDLSRYVDSINADRPKYKRTI